MSGIKDFKNNETFILVDEDGDETECFPTIFNDGNKKYAYFQIIEGNSNECFLVSIIEVDGIKKMKLSTSEEFKILKQIYFYHPFTPDYYPIEIDENDFARGYYKIEKNIPKI